MEVKKVVVDKLPRDCIECPLAYGHKRECGKLTTYKENGAARDNKKPDEWCKCKER